MKIYLKRNQVPIIWSIIALIVLLILNKSCTVGVGLLFLCGMIALLGDIQVIHFSIKATLINSSGKTKAKHLKQLHYDTKTRIDMQNLIVASLIGIFIFIVATVTLSSIILDIGLAILVFSIMEFIKFLYLDLKYQKFIAQN